MSKSILPILGLLLFLSACVSSKKYDAAISEQDRLQQKIAELKPFKEELAICQVNKASIQNQLTESIANYQDLLARYQDLNKRHIELGKKYEEQVRQNSDLLENSSTQVVELYDKLDGVRDSMEIYRKRMINCEAKLVTTTTELDTLRSRLMKSEEESSKLQEMLSGRQAQMDELRTKLRDALIGFSSADLSISQKGGRLYVSMSQDLLFRSGSDQIDSKGRDAIEKLAVVLQNKPDLDVLVEGHTDSEGSVNFNWDLSVKRATQVVKILVENQLPAEQITACGRGEHHPVATNDTVEGKAKNRRTEIILAPNLSELYKLMYNEK